MNFKEAKKRLDELAPDLYRAIKYEITTKMSGEMSQVCEIYVESIGAFKGAFWETVFADLEAHGAGRPVISEDLD